MIITVYKVLIVIRKGTANSRERKMALLPYRQGYYRQSCLKLFYSNKTYKHENMFKVCKYQQHSMIAQ
jgi:hypothetical protein